MTQLWDAEQGIDADRAARLIDAQFPALSPAHVQPLGEGWDNAVFVVNGRWAFRFPRRAVAVPILATEAALLPDLAPHLTLPIPVPRFDGLPGDGYPWPFLGYTLLPGTIAARAGLADAQRAALAAPLAHFLRALHALPPDFALARGVPLDKIARLDADRRAAVTDERLHMLVQRGVLPSRAVIDAVLATPDGHTASARHLVHGDLHAGQLLVQTGRDADTASCALAGVIDWGDVHVGDPGTDLAVVHALLPVAAHERFLAAYGEVDPGRWAAARRRATWHGVALAAYGTDIGDAALVAEALGSLRRILGDDMS
jgi:aminoglycoside phosphotransferase (APT) family kinase protein